MSEEKDVKDEGDKGAVTLESLAAEMATQKVSQDEVVEALRADGISNVTRLEQVIRDRDGDIQNLTNLLGNLAKPEETPAEEDYTEMSSSKVKDIVTNAIADTKKAETDAVSQENDAYWDEYATEVQEHMGEEGPDNKPLSKEAREGIMELLKTSVITRTKNATKDAYKNHKEATKIYFGLGKKPQHVFQGGDTHGTGGGGSGFNGGTKKTYTLSPAMKNELKELGETEEWGLKKMEERAEREAAMA
jgi:hypothetical protein